MEPAVQRRSSRRRSRRGATLVEILVACVILAIVAVGTAACLYMAQGATAVQRNRRTAVELASSQLEELRSAPYALISQLGNNYNIYYIDRLTGNWRVTGANHDETVLVNGQRRPITTTVQWFDADGAGDIRDCIRLKVSVQYGRNASDIVTLETLESP